MSIRRIVDAHHHIIDLDSNYYPWLSDQVDPSFFLGDYSSIRRNFLRQDYLAATTGYNLVGSVHVEAEWDRSAQVAETRWLTDLAKDGLPAAIVGHVWLANADCEEVLAGHAAYPLARGVRSKPLTAPSADVRISDAPGSMQDPAWRRGYGLLEKFGFSYDLRVPYWHLEEAAEVAGRFPGVPVAINHAGLPLDRHSDGLALWRKGMQALAEFPHVHLKIAELGHPHLGWDEAGNRQIIREAVEIFGPSRCMFGSNLPVSSLTASFATIVDTVHAAISDLTDDEIDAIFAANAISFYRMELSEG